MKLTEFTYKGIKKITVPITRAELESREDGGLSIIVYFLNSSVIAEHNLNKAKIKYLHDFYLGDQDIKNKERLYHKPNDKNDSENNNKDVENHCMAQVDFKKHFLCGEKRKFAKKGDDSSEDIAAFERFLSDCSFYAKDMECKEWIYSTGIGVTFAILNTDIIDKNGRIADDYDKNNDSPFTFDTVSPENNFVVYSSKGSKLPLFCVTESKDFRVQEDSQTCEEIDVLEIRTRDFYWKLCKNNYEVLDAMPQAFHWLPMIEHSVNASRIGITEINRDCFHVINLIVSNSADAIVDSANQIYVFDGIEMDETQLNEMIAAGAICLPKDDGGGTAQRRFYTVEIPFKLGDIEDFYEQRCIKAYDIAGVPLASSTVTSGGDTGQARLLGGGWNNAYTKIKGDIIGLSDCDYQLLKLLINICKLIPDSPLNNLHSSQVDIKYSINPNDNILSKAQAAVNLRQIGMPTAMILEKTGLSMDVNADGKAWNKEIEKLNNDIEKNNRQKTNTTEDVVDKQ